MPKPPARWICLLLCVCTGIGSAIPAERGEPYAVIMSSESSLMQRLSTPLSVALRARGIDTAVIDADNSSTGIAARANLVIASHALAGKLADIGTPLLIVNTGHERKPGSAINTMQYNVQQPACRYIALASALSGRILDLGIITTDPALQQHVERCRKPAKININIIMHHDGDELSDNISRVLQNDILIALPDRDIYNGSSVKNILLSAYRKRVPVIGFSRAFTRAGAIVSLHSSIAQLADEIADAAELALAADASAGVRWPRDYSISINLQVSRSLDIDIPDELVLRQRIDEALR